jgi:hypothetical protein
LENQRSTVTSAPKSESDSSIATSLKTRVAELQQDLLAARQETKTVREEASAVRQEARELNAELSQWRQTALGPELSQEESCRRLCDELIAEALKGEGGALTLLVSPAISNA